MKLLVVPAVALLCLVSVACGGESNDASDPSPTAVGGQSTTASSEALTDEQYLAVMCDGLQDFSAAVDSATTTEEIESVVQEFVANLSGVTPPSDVETYHREFLAYLSESLEEPTELLTREPPVPADDVRERLAEAEDSVSECEDLAFFDEREAS